MEGQCEFEGVVDDEAVGLSLRPFHHGAVEHVVLEGVGEGEGDQGEECPHILLY